MKAIISAGAIFGALNWANSCRQSYIAERAARAWLNPGSPDQTSFVADIPIVLNIPVTNTGKGAARNIFYRSFVTMRTHPLRDEFSPLDTELPLSVASIEPGSGLNMEIKFGPLTPRADSPYGPRT